MGNATTQACCSEMAAGWGEQTRACPKAASSDTKDTGAASIASLSATHAVLHHNIVLGKWLQSPSHFSLLILAADSASGMSARSLESLYSVCSAEKTDEAKTQLNL